MVIINARHVNRAGKIRARICVSILLCRLARRPANVASHQARIKLLSLNVRVERETGRETWKHRKRDISVVDAGSEARTEIVLINATGPRGRRCGLR